MTSRNDGRDEERDALPGEEELEELYSAEYLQECADGDARQERLEELKRRIAHDAYKVDPETIAEEMLARGDISKG